MYIFKTTVTFKLAATLLIACHFLYCPPLFKSPVYFHIDRQLHQKRLEKVLIGNDVSGLLIFKLPKKYSSGGEANGHLCLGVHIFSPNTAVLWLFSTYFGVASELFQI